MSHIVPKGLPRTANRFRNLMRLELLEDRVVPATFAVSNLSDVGAGSLRQAILDANAAVGADDVIFDLALIGGTIDLASSLPIITDVVTIISPGVTSAGITVNGKSALGVRPFEVAAGAGAVTLGNLTITGGETAAGQSGGGLLNAGGATTLDNVTVTGNIADDDGGGIFNSGTLTITNSAITNNKASLDDGGGTLNTGTLTVTDSRIEGNRSGDNGGGLATREAGSVATLTRTTVAGNTAGIAGLGGGIDVINDGVLNVIDSTISGNRSPEAGGGIRLSTGSARVVNSTIAYNISDGNDGGGGISVGSGATALTVVNSTIVGNADTSNDTDGGGGISVETAAPNVAVVNSIVSRNTAGPASPDNNVQLADLDTNTNNFLGGDPRLGPLQDNGGPTFTLLPLAGSPVINTGSNAVATETGLAGGTPLTTDQRGTGFLRIVDGVVDIGAVEFSPTAPTPGTPAAVTPTIVVNSLADGAPAADGQLTLREAIIAATTNAASGDAPAGIAGLDIIGFDASLFGGTINLSAGQLTLTGGGDVQIVGPGGVPGGITISGQDAVRVLEITAAASAVTLQDLTITRGNAGVGNDGGGLLNAGPNTTLAGVAVTRNQAGDQGGGLFNTGTLSLTNAEVSNNRSEDDGGGIRNTGVLTVNASRIVGNATGTGGGDNGGGLDSDGATATASIAESTIAGNFAGNNGGGIINRGGATLSLQRSTVYGNQAAGEGGGVRVSSGTATVLNSTIAHNIADSGSGGGGFNIGGGTVTIVNSTVLGNADTSNDLNGAGGISAVAGATITLANTIVSQNFAAPGSVDDNVDPLDLDVTGGNMLGGNPLLGPLDDNGGPTFTMRPFPDSVVIDVGSNARATETGAAGGTPLATDQRGFLRILDGNANAVATVDIGAVEFQSPGVALTLVTSVNPSLVGSPVTFTATVAPTATAPNNPVSGSVAFVIDGAIAATVPLTAGTAAFTTATLTVGSHTVVAEYLGDGNYDPDAVSLAAPQVVTGIQNFAAGPGPGLGPTVRYFNPDATEKFSVAAFEDPSFTGGVRVAVGDFTGDGVPDLVVGTGPGITTRVRVLDGVTQTELFAITPFEDSFTGGVYVAAGDVTGDGKADLVITPDEGGGPRVRIFDGNGFVQIADYFGIDDPAFRGGARAAVGDVNGDGLGDLVVAAGFLGGPRITIWDGGSVLAGTPSQLANFFAFEDTLRNGAFVAAGDFNGDGFADAVFGGGPGGGPRVRIFDGPGLLAAAAVPVPFVNVDEVPAAQLANFFGGDPANRGGIRLTAKDLDGDARADLVVGDGTDAGSQVTGYLGIDIPANDTPPEQFAVDAFPGFTGGVFVG